MTEPVGAELGLLEVRAPRARRVGLVTEEMDWLDRSGRASM
jgi:hypothetical protein